MAITTANNATLRLAIGNSLDSVFVWSIPLGGKRAYSDGSCPSSLDATLTGDAGSQFGAAIALSENGRTLVVGSPGSASSPDASVLVADISPSKAAAAPAPSAGGYAGALFTPSASTAASLDSSYFLSNPSTVLVSARRGSVGVPASQRFSLSSWAAGSPGGAPHNPANGGRLLLCSGVCTCHSCLLLAGVASSCHWLQECSLSNVTTLHTCCQLSEAPLPPSHTTTPAAGYSISPVSPYSSGGTPVQQTVVGVTSALQVRRRACAGDAHTCMHACAQLMPTFARILLLAPAPAPVQSSSNFPTRPRASASRLRCCAMRR